MSKDFADINKSEDSEEKITLSAISKQIQDIGGRFQKQEKQIQDLQEESEKHFRKLDRSNRDMQEELDQLQRDFRRI